MVSYTDKHCMSGGSHVYGNDTIGEGSGQEAPKLGSRAVCIFVFSFKKC